MGNESDPNWQAAQQRLNMGQDPGGAFPDLRDRYRKQQEEIASSTRGYQSSSYPSHGSSSGSTSQSQSKSNSSRISASKTSKSSTSPLKGIFALGGFIVGIFWGFNIFGSNASEYWIAIILIGVGCGWLAAVSYKLIIGVAMLITLIFVLAGTDKKPAKKESPKGSSQSAEQPIKSSTAPSAARDSRVLDENGLAKGGRIYVKNNCHKGVSLALKYRRLNGDWETKFWWKIDGNDFVPLSHADRYLISDNSIFYYYAKTEDGYWWGGEYSNGDDRTESLGGKNYRFQRIKLSKDNDGDWVLSLGECSG
nr:hypothetical protein [Nitrosomonas nitrosa]